MRNSKKGNLKFEIKNSKAITLIALVITVIVLLILAGVSIATLTGENGLLTKTSDAKIETALGAVKEALRLEQSEKIIDNINLTPELLLAERKATRTVHQGEDNTYYMYYVLKENAYKEMEGLGKGNLAELKDVFLIDEKLNIKYISKDGKIYGDEIEKKILEDTTPIRFSSKAFSEYISNKLGIEEDKMTFKLMKNQTTLTITDSNITSLADLVFFPELQNLYLENMTLEDLEGIQNCVKLQIFQATRSEIKDYMQLSKLPNLNRFYLLIVKNADFDNIIDSLKTVKTLKSFIINVTAIDTNSMKRISELSDNLETIYLKTTYNIEKIEGLEKKTNLKNLYLGGNKIKKIEGLENCVNLEKLDLESNQITKIENLEQLQNLTTLFLGNNQIEDILELDKNIKLTNLDLRNNPKIKSNRSEYNEGENDRLDKIQEIITVRNGVININPEQIRLFLGYKRLEPVNNTNISTLEFLEGQTELEYLSLVGCKNITLTDIKSQEILKNMKKLNTLYLSGTNIKDLRAINELENLEKISLGAIGQLDLSQIEDIISQVSISDLKQEDIDSISKCTKEKIKKLDISGTFTKLPNIEDLPNLNTLILNKNKQIENFNTVSNCENLVDLRLSEVNLHERMIDFSKLKNLTNLDLSNNTLWDKDLENLKALKDIENLTINLSNNSLREATSLLDLNTNTKIKLSGNVNLTENAKTKLRNHFKNNVTF